MKKFMCCIYGTPFLRKKVKAKSFKKAAQIYMARHSESCLGRSVHVVVKEKKTDKYKHFDVYSEIVCTAEEVK